MEKTIGNSLTDAIHLLSMYQDDINAEILENVIRKYPKYASELTEFAIELAIDSALYEVNDEDYIADLSDAVDPILSRVMSKVQNSLYNVRENSLNSLTKENQIRLENPFEVLSRPEFRSLVSKVGVSTVFLSKIRDKQINPDTIPERFMNYLAEKMQVSLKILKDYLFAKSLDTSAGQFFKSEGRPSYESQQSFDDAIKESFLNDDSQKKLLSFKD